MQDPLTFEIIGGAMEVHRHLGPGYLEAVYHDALVIELEERGIETQREVPYPVYYKGRRLAHPYRADLVCNGEVLVELKAHSGLGAADEAQILHYLTTSRLSTGLLVNFGLPSLQHRRFVMGLAWKARIGVNPC
jgi:GxxExxY protein